MADEVDGTTLSQSQIDEATDGKSVGAPSLAGRAVGDDPPSSVPTGEEGLTAAVPGVVAVADPPQSNAPSSGEAQDLPQILRTPPVAVCGEDAVSSGAGSGRLLLASGATPSASPFEDAGGVEVSATPVPQSIDEPYTDYSQGDFPPPVSMYEKISLSASLASAPVAMMSFTRSTDLVISPIMMTPNEVNSPRTNGTCSRASPQADAVSRSLAHASDGAPSVRASPSSAEPRSVRTSGGISPRKPTDVSTSAGAASTGKPAAGSRPKNTDTGSPSKVNIGGAPKSTNKPFASTPAVVSSTLTSGSPFTTETGDFSLKRTACPSNTADAVTPSKSTDERTSRTSWGECSPPKRALCAPKSTERSSPSNTTVSIPENAPSECSLEKASVDKQNIASGECSAETSTIDPPKADEYVHSLSGGPFQNSKILSLNTDNDNPGSPPFGNSSTDIFLCDSSSTDTEEGAKSASPGVNPEEESADFVDMEFLSDKGGLDASTRTNRGVSPVANEPSPIATQDYAKTDGVYNCSLNSTDSDIYVISVDKGPVQLDTKSPDSVKSTGSDLGVSGEVKSVGFYDSVSPANSDFDIVGAQENDVLLQGKDVLKFACLQDIKISIVANKEHNVTPVESDTEKGVSQTDTVKDVTAAKEHNSETAEGKEIIDDMSPLGKDTQGSSKSADSDIEVIEEQESDVKRLERDVQHYVRLTNKTINTTANQDNPRPLEREIQHDAALTDSDIDIIADQENKRYMESQHDAGLTDSDIDMIANQKNKRPLKRRIFHDTGVTDIDIDIMADQIDKRHEEREIQHGAGLTDSDIDIMADQIDKRHEEREIQHGSGLTDSDIDMIADQIDKRHGEREIQHGSGLTDSDIDIMADQKNARPFGRDIKNAGLTDSDIDIMADQKSARPFGRDVKNAGCLTDSDVETEDKENIRPPDGNMPVYFSSSDSEIFIFEDDDDDEMMEEQEQGSAPLTDSDVDIMAETGHCGAPLKFHTQHFAAQTDTDFDMLADQENARSSGRDAQATADLTGKYVDTRGEQQKGATPLETHSHRSANPTDDDFEIV